MTKAKSDIPCPVTLGLTKAQLARAFDYGPEKFSELLPHLEMRGFPRPHPVLQRWLVAEVEAWIAREARICAAQASEATLPAADTGGASPALRLIQGRLRPEKRNGKD